ncbi:NADH:flavin oxidoreductase [Reinekea blandensis]|uniref:Oxidoreductase n=1 Tax=Reinekea blandensis MED297 TaxID=314283 RepID=A4BIH2_9GAMM|nr:NADH:flavin oxidoreductase [Reinekea blandensis]EAR08051.1 oxidoreductase [Reinekea sp. MED297] [Reinekea blandensis MED297]
MTSLFTPLELPNGRVLPNRFMLAPMTNKQSHEDGTLSDEELHWLTMRAKGGFGATMTCAANVQANGKGWSGELGVYEDAQLPGLQRLAEGIQAHESLALVQIFHGGCRAPAELIGQHPVAPSDHAETGARALRLDEVIQLRDDFIAAAVRCQRAGFDGVELHGAHNYILCQFLSTEYNRRTDAYGGSAENRSRLLREVIAGIRQACGNEFIVGVRLSPEGFGLAFAEMLTLSESLMREAGIDFLDISLWDCFGSPKDPDFQHKRLIDWYAELPRYGVPLGVAGKLRTPADIQQAMATGVDFVLLGRAAIIHHDFPARMQADELFEPRSLPVSRATLAEEGLSPTFVDYMGRWEGFVEG